VLQWELEVVHRSLEVLDSESDAREFWYEATEPVSLGKGQVKLCDPSLRSIQAGDEFSKVAL
jgi:hypothetical protein